MHYVNTYDFTLAGLRFKNFLNGNHNILEWISTIALNRYHNNIRDADIIWFEEFGIYDNAPGEAKYDAYIGYRADDNTWDCIQSFLSNLIDIESVTKMLYEGNQGIEIALKTYRAIENLEYIRTEEYDAQSASEYYWKELDSINNIVYNYRDNVSWTLD